MPRPEISKLIERAREIGGRAHARAAASRVGVSLPDGSHGLVDDLSRTVIDLALVVEHLDNQVDLLLSDRQAAIDRAALRRQDERDR